MRAGHVHEAVFPTLDPQGLVPSGDSAEICLQCSLYVVMREPLLSCPLRPASFQRGIACSSPWCSGPKPAAEGVSEAGDLPLGPSDSATPVSPVIRQQGCWRKGCHLMGQGRVDRRVAHTCPCPNPGNVWPCFLTWQKGLCRCNEVHSWEIPRFICVGPG